MGRGSIDTARPPVPAVITQVEAVEAEELCPLRERHRGSFFCFYCGTCKHDRDEDECCPAHWATGNALPHIGESIARWRTMRLDFLLRDTPHAQCSYGYRAWPCVTCAPERAAQAVVSTAELAFRDDWFEERGGAWQLPGFRADLCPFSAHHTEDFYCNYCGRCRHEERYQCRNDDGQHLGQADWRRYREALVLGFADHDDCLTREPHENFLCAEHSTGLTPERMIYRPGDGLYEVNDNGELVI